MGVINKQLYEEKQDSIKENFEKAQKYKNYEHIVIDSFSNDNTYNLIENYCETNNLVLDDLIIDEGISGKDIKNRKGFHSVLEMLENGELGTLIVLSLSRMGRKPFYTFLLCRTIPYQ